MHRFSPLFTELCGVTMSKNKTNLSLLPNGSNNFKSQRTLCSFGVNIYSKQMEKDKLSFRPTSKTKKNIRVLLDFFPFLVEVNKCLSFAVLFPARLWKGFSGNLWNHLMENLWKLKSNYFKMIFGQFLFPACSRNLANGKISTEEVFTAIGIRWMGLWRFDVKKIGGTAKRCWKRYCWNSFSIQIR